MAEPNTKVLTVKYNEINIIDELPISDSVEIKYNNQIISTIEDGLKVIKCADKIMKSDLVIGGKTLKCGGKLMKSDIHISVEDTSITEIILDEFIIDSYATEIEFVYDA